MISVNNQTWRKVAELACQIDTMTIRTGGRGHGRSLREGGADLESGQEREARRPDSTIESTDVDD